MTDKLIMINGVDVSGCEHLGLYKEYKLKCGGCYPVDCSDNPNCYYKQLKHKAQECEELKKQLERKEENYQKLLSKSNKYIHNLVDENVQDISNLGRQLDQLKTEKEEIKKYLGISSKTIMERLEELQEFRDNDKYKLYQAEQTLTEIKEIAEKHKVTAHYDYLTDMDNIIQKISECGI